MISNEWLNIQDIFALFLGRWIMLYAAAGFVAVLSMSILGILWRRLPRIQIVGKMDD